MTCQVEFRLNHSDAAAIAEHLNRCDKDFLPPLSERIEIGNYAHKIAESAARFEAWCGGELIALVAVYCNDSVHRIAHITSVSVLRERSRRGISSKLLKDCILHLKEKAFKAVELEVDSNNRNAVKLYEKAGFKLNKLNGHTAGMSLNIEGEK